jgi:small subunit ribosomal protein S1
LEENNVNHTEPTNLEAAMAPVAEHAAVAEPAPAAPQPQAQSKPAAIPIKHDDFDWSVGKRQTKRYSGDEKKTLEDNYDSSFKSIEDGQLMMARVMAITSNDAVLNIGYKSDGLVSLSEFRDLPDLKTGDEVEVLVVEKENLRGQLVLSHKEARQQRAWEKIMELYKSQEIVTGYVSSKTKGGLIVELYGMETFLPGSQIDVKPITDYDVYVGKNMEFKVVKINETIKNAVVSHKALIESDIEEQRQAIISTLEKGQVLEGTIKNITDFGAFIDLGGVDGLLYITDITWGRINHPNEVLQLDQKINVVVLDYDENKKRISLGLKQLNPHPWDTLQEEIAVGSKVKGKIVNIEEYGAFLEITPGVEGLIHVSEISWSSQPVNTKDLFKMGEELEAVVVTIDRAERKMSLSLRQLTKDPWSDIETRYPVGTRHKGIVRNINPYGVFVELENAITGFVHISDLSWLKRYNHPNEFTKVGNELEVVVLDLDKENRKLSLGHKQIEEDPWDTFEQSFPVGSVHPGTVMKRDDKGAVIALPYGVEGYAPNKHLKKENGKLAEVDEVIDFKVLEFDRGNKRILVSHSRLIDDKMDEGRKKEGEARSKDRRETKDRVKDINKRSERTTLGDLAAFKSLKENLDKEE